MSGRFLPPIYFSYITLCVYIALWMIYSWYGYTGPWIDRLILLELFFVAIFTVGAMAWKTVQWSRRGLGIWGWMGAIAVLTLVSMAVAWGYLERPVSQGIINLYRAPFLVGCNFLILGYFFWFLHKEWDRPDDQELPI